MPLTFASTFRCAMDVFVQQLKGRQPSAQTVVAMIIQVDDKAMFQLDRDDMLIVHFSDGSRCAVHDVCLNTLH